MRNTISASTALWVMSLPQVGPTFSTDTDDADLCVSAARTPATLAASWVLTPVAFLASFASTFRLCLLPLPSTVIVAPPKPSGVSAFCACATVTPGAATCHEVPPTNSML